MDEVSPAVAVPFRPFTDPHAGLRGYCNGESRVTLPESSCSGDGAMKDSSFEINTRQDSLTSSSSAMAGVDISAGDEINGSDEFDPRSMNQSEKKVLSRTESRSLFEFKCVPLYGVTSICGRRPEMEDSVSTIPRFLQVSSSSLLDGRVTNGFNPHLSAHFFGVYDGHGGSQVMNRFGFDMI
jgi:protein phosphatase 2C